MNNINYLILVNKSNILEKRYYDNLLLVECKNVFDETIRVEKTTYKGFLRLKKFLEIKNIYIELDSAYRSFEEQQRVIDDFTVKYGEEYTKKIVAPIGTSEHHTGLAIDIDLMIDGTLYYENDDLFKYEDIFLEIHKYLYKFGFILRYPKGKEKITGFDYEPWHIRYVGIDTAEFIYKNNLTLEEYLSNKEQLSNLTQLKDIDKEIYQCNLCNGMIEKFPNNKTVSIGKKNDIVILGEAPANNGWRKSGIAWYDINNKLLPSGVILQKLLDEINLRIEDTYFLEAIKCYPLNRKYLNKCSENCKKYLFKQLEIIKPKIILSLGDAATRSILVIKYNKFSDVVGKEFDVNGYKVIPIYHPSPISPKSYKGNIEIFKRIKIK